ncbi:MAG TPA: hypothetical protein VG650_01160 [Mycobacteriales bacterium]|nr:hypothetical protein [Mycobacteriales bacterium]
MADAEATVAAEESESAAAFAALLAGGGSPGLTLIRAVGPRLLRDILGPPAAFYGVWKATGNVLAGVGVASAVSVLIYAYERRKGRPGLIARVVLLFVLASAIVGIATNSATAYLIQPAVLGAINGALWLGSVARDRPLAATFAREVFPVDEATRTSPEYHSVFRRVSLLFGIFFVVAAAIQLVVLLIVGVGAFLATRVADALGILTMIVYCVRYISGRIGQELIPHP